MSLNQLTTEYLDAQANESRAFQAIEGAGTGEQWDAYFDAQDETFIALEVMLWKTGDIALSMTNDEDTRNNITSLFHAAIHRGGVARKIAIEKALELARLDWGEKLQK